MLFSSGVHRRGASGSAPGFGRAFPGVPRSAAMSEPGLQARATAQASAHVDINVHVTTGGAAAASASAQPNVQRPESRQHNIASFFGKRTAPTGSEPETVGAAGRERPKKPKITMTVEHNGKTCATALCLAIRTTCLRGKADSLSVTVLVYSQ